MRTRAAFWATLMVLIGATVSPAQVSDNGRLTVFGKVRTFAKTDRARVTFQIKGVGKSLRAAFADAEAKIEAVGARLEAIGVDRGNLATSFFQSGENYGNKAFLSSKRDYRTLMTATVTTDRIEKMKEVVIALSESDLESIQDISFELTNYAELREAALRRAIEKARDKADVACDELGFVRGRILEVEELQGKVVGASSGWKRRVPTPFNEPMFAFSNDFFEQAPGSTGIFPQETRFDSEVRVVFALDDSPASLTDEGRP